MISRRNSLIESIDILAIAGVVFAVWGLSLNYKNMRENEEQTKSLKEHLENQDNDYLKKSIDQNEKILKNNDLIIKQNDDILKKL
jgi:hypothetical protein